MTQAQSKVKSLDEFYSSGWMSINKPLEFSSFDVAKEFFYSTEYQAAHELLKDKKVVRNHQIIEGS